MKLFAALLFCLVFGLLAVNPAAAGQHLINILC